ncbi:MAG: hypothetical protein ABH851_09090 [Methanobacteriota archaeon]
MVYRSRKVQTRKDSDGEPIETTRAVPIELPPDTGKAARVTNEELAERLRIEMGKDPTAREACEPYVEPPDYIKRLKAEWKKNR